MIGLANNKGLAHVRQFYLVGTARGHSRCRPPFSRCTEKARRPGRDAKLGNDRAGHARRGNGGTQMARNSTGAGAQHLFPQTTVVGKNFDAPKITDDVAAAKFACVVVGFTPRQLSKASGRTIEAAKHWLAGTRAPSTASIINMARAIPAVNAWLQEEASAGNRAAQADSSDARIQALRFAARRSDADGESARIALRIMGID